MPRQDLPFPVKGQDKSVAYYAQPPQSTPAAQNVRSDDNVEGRARGGTRPGLARVYQTRMGSAGNRFVRMAEQVRVVDPDANDVTSVSTFEPIPNPSAPPWPGWQTFTATPAITAQPDGVDMSDGKWLRAPSLGVTRGLTRTALFTDFDNSQDYSIEVRTRWDTLGGVNHSVRIYFGMDDATPDGTAAGTGYAQVLVNGGTNQYEVRVYAAGVQVPPTSQFGTQNTGETDRSIKVTVSGTNPQLVTVQVGNDSYTGFSVAGPPAGTRWGISLTSSPIVADIRPEITFRYGSSANIPPNRTVAVYSAFDSLLTNPGGGIWRETNASDDVQRVDIDPYNLVPDLNLQGAQRTGLLYIADYVTIFSGTAEFYDTGGGVNDGYQFRDLNINNLIAAGTQTWDCVVFPEESMDGSVKAGTYPIAGLGNSQGTGDAVALLQTGVPEVPFTGVPVGTQVPFRIERRPKVYNPVDDTFTHLTAETDEDDFYGLGTDFLKGPVPCGNALIALHLDRLFLAGNPLDPQNWTCSREGNPRDWYTSGIDVGDTGRPMNSQNTSAGVIGEPITAMISFTDDYMIFGATNSLWVLRGNPAEAGAGIENISDTIGIVDANSWARLPDGSMLFLSRDGIYHMPYGADTTPTRVSRKRLPRELLNIDRANTEVFMSWDVNFEGLLIFLTPRDGTTVRPGWFYQLDEDAWWPEVYDVDHPPTSLLDYESDISQNNGVYLAARDGYVRRHLFGNSNDDGISFLSYIVFGPFLLGPDEWTEGIIKALSIRLSDSSTDVTWSYFTGETAEEAALAAGNTMSTPFASGTSTAGLNYKIRERMRGKYWCLRLESSALFAVELLTAEYKAAGMERAKDSS